MAETVLLKAVDLAREVAIEAAEDAAYVGEHLGATEIDERLVTHQFAASVPGYRGWVWEVTVTRAPRGKDASICEAHLVPADDALLAPAWDTIEVAGTPRPVLRTNVATGLTNEIAYFLESRPRIAVRRVSQDGAQREDTTFLEVMGEPPGSEK